jgi:hypothetical protein
MVHKIGTLLARFLFLFKIPLSLALEYYLLYGFLWGALVMIIKNDSILACTTGYAKVLCDQVCYIDHRVGRIVEIITNSNVNKTTMPPTLVGCFM